MKYCNMGFAAVDGTGLDLADTEEQTVEGLYDQLIAAYGSDKPVVLYGAASGESTVSPYVCQLTQLDDAVVIDASLNVNSSDVVTPVE